MFAVWRFFRTPTGAAVSEVSNISSEGNSVPLSAESRSSGSIGTGLLSLSCLSGSMMSADFSNSPTAPGDSFFFAGTRPLRTLVGFFAGAARVTIFLVAVAFVGVVGGTSGSWVPRIGAPRSADISESDNAVNRNSEFKGEDSRDDDGEAEGDGDISLSARDISGSMRLIAYLDSLCRSCWPSQ